jgi:autotransporter-associated beta strand protein
MHLHDMTSRGICEDCFMCLRTSAGISSTKSITYMKSVPLLLPIFLGLVHLSPAANITWQTPQAVSSALDVNTQGTLFTAKSTGGAYTVNGVFFDPAAANFAETFNNGAVGFMNGQTFIGTNDTDGQAYAGLMDVAHLFNPDGATQATITFSNLTINQEYLVQLWVADYRGYPNDRHVTLTGGANTSGQLKYLDSDNSNGGIHGSYVIGTFTADATSQAILIDSNESTQMQAVQLRTNLGLADADGIWTGADGNWSDAANWDANTVAHGIDKSATFNGLTPVIATVDAGHPIGALNFSGANHTIATGAGSLTLDGDTIFATPTVTVAGGLTATITAKLASADVLTKAGTGTLTLSAQNNFSNEINVSQGTLELAIDWTFGNVGTGTAIVPGLVTVENGATLRAVNSVANQLNGLILNDGTVEAVGVPSGDWGNFHLTGNVTATGTSNLNADIALRASNMDFFVDSGGTLNVGGVMHNGAYFGIYSGAPANVSKSGTGTMVLSAANTYTGSTTVDAGTLEITNTGGLRFIPTTNGVTNSVSTIGTGTLSFLGTVSLDLGAAVAAGGNTWNLFNLTSFTGLTPTAVTSTLGSFTEVTPGIWEFPVTGAKWVFTESNGNLAYTVTATPYETWGSTYGLAAGTEGGDLDNDGLTNFEEYSFGLIPNSGSSVNAFALPFNKATGTFSYTRRTQSLTGLNYTVWYSTDLTGWTQDTTAVQGTPSVSGEVETVPVTLTGSLLTNPKLFIQLRAE